MKALDHSSAAAITVESDDGAPPAIQVSTQALRLFAAVLGALSKRREVVLMPAKRKFSIVEAANYLNFVAAVRDQGDRGRPVEAPLGGQPSTNRVRGPAHLR
jgi:hypothetical protein